jgi:hypothetical protein
MTALAKSVARMRLDTSPIAVGRGPAAASITFYEGSILMTNAGGYVTVGATATGQFVRGICTTAKVSPASNGAVEVGWEEGDFELESGTAGDAITVANIGDTAWIIDDNTVGATNGGATRSEAGKIVAISPNGKPIVRVMFTGV